MKRSRENTCVIIVTKNDIYTTYRVDVYRCFRRWVNVGGVGRIEEHLFLSKKDGETDVVCVMTPAVSFV